MTVFVTGVGFIGGHVVRNLVAAGQKVVLFGYLGGTGDPSGPVPELEYIHELIDGDARDLVEVEIGDVGDLDAMTRAADRHGARSIMHFATMLSAGAEASPWLATRVNVMGTANVFETAARLAMEKVVWCSSNSVFGPRSGDEHGRLTDDSVYDPEWTYGGAKVMGEKLAVAYANKYGLNITGIRPGRTYGFGEHVKLTRGGGSSWLNNLLYNPVVTNEPCVVPFGSRKLDFLYVEDLAAGMVKALRYQDPNGTGNYLIGGDYRPVAEAVEFVRTLLPEASITLDDADLELVPGSTLGFSRQSDWSRAHADFGYEAKHHMEAGVFRTINQYRKLVNLPPIEEPEVARLLDSTAAI
jgi:UDP-glucose 4-epimerase